MSISDLAVLDWLNYKLTRLYYQSDIMCSWEHYLIILRILSQQLNYSTWSPIFGLCSCKIHKLNKLRSPWIG